MRTAVFILSFLISTQAFSTEDKQKCLEAVTAQECFLSLETIKKIKSSFINEAIGPIEIKKDIRLALESDLYLNENPEYGDLKGETSAYNFLGNTIYNHASAPSLIPIKTAIIISASALTVEGKDCFIEENDICYAALESIESIKGVYKVYSNEEELILHTNHVLRKDSYLTDALLKLIKKEDQKNKPTEDELNTLLSSINVFSRFIHSKYTLTPPLSSPLTIADASNFVFRSLLIEKDGTVQDETLFLETSKSALNQCKSEAKTSERKMFISLGNRGM